MIESTAQVVITPTCPTRRSAPLLRSPKKREPGHRPGSRVSRGWSGSMNRSLLTSGREPQRDAAQLSGSP